MRAICPGCYLLLEHQIGAKVHGRKEIRYFLSETMKTKWV
jgi:hypothetical protein